MAVDLMSSQQMLSLGIIGGISWHSTIAYYRHINDSINSLYGNQTNPPLVIYNLNQAQIHGLQRTGRWNEIAEIFYQAAFRLKSAGCQGLLFACNTAHKVFDDVACRIDLPMLHMADAIGIAARQSGVNTVGLIGTRFVMEHDFLSRRLLEDYALQTLTPASDTSRARLHDIIQRELTMGMVTPDAKRFIIQEVAQLRACGAGAIVLGCTELPSMFGDQDLNLPTLDTTVLHAKLAVDFILGRNQILRSSTRS